MESQYAAWDLLPRLIATATSITWRRYRQAGHGIKQTNSNHSVWECQTPQLIYYSHTFPSLASTIQLANHTKWYDRKGIRFFSSQPHEFGCTVVAQMASTATRFITLGHGSPPKLLMDMVTAHRSCPMHFCDINMKISWSIFSHRNTLNKLLEHPMPPYITPRWTDTCKITTY